MKEASLFLLLLLLFVLQTRIEWKRKFYNLSNLYVWCLCFRLSYTHTLTHNE